MLSSSFPFSFLCVQPRCSFACRAHRETGFESLSRRLVDIRAGMGQTLGTGGSVAPTRGHWLAQDAWAPFREAPRTCPLTFTKCFPAPSCYFFFFPSFVLPC